MRNKSVILLAIALGCGMIASVGISQVVMNSSSGEAQMVEILVASQEIPANTKVTADNIMLEKWPAGRTPEGAITDIAELEDKYARQHIYAGEALLKQKVVDATQRATVGIPQGHTVVTYPIGSEPGIANLIEPGDRINVIGFFEKSDIVPATTHKDIFRNVKIFAVDGRTTRDPDASAKHGTPGSVLLLIRQEDERVWNWANKVGSLKLTLGNPNEEVNPDAPNAAGQEFMTWLEDYAEQRRLSLVEPEEETPVSKPGGEIIKMLTPKGYRLYRWNKSNQTMEMIEEQTPNDLQLGAEAEEDIDGEQATLEQEEASSGRYGESRRVGLKGLNRAR